MNENKIQIDAEEVDASLVNEWRAPIRLHGDVCNQIRENQCNHCSLAYIVADTIEVICYFALVIGMLFFTLTVLNILLF